MLLTCQPCLPLAGISPGGVVITAIADDGTASSRMWMSEWTIFYYGWWIAWAPFVGMFIAKISRGRTVRTIINGGMSAPVLYACALLRCLLACVACAGRASVLRALNTTAWPHCLQLALCRCGS